MGRAKRWLRGLLRGKKPSLAGDNPKPAKENRGWGFARSFRDVESQNDGDEAAADMVRKGAAFWEGSPRPHAGAAASAGNAKEDQSKRAIAMAAATAAVAEAAVAAAQAAAAVVRLTGGGRCPGVCVAGRNAELWAAIKIQAAFRGYLARRALRALRGLVKLQALVRGHIVRKQAAETLRCMQALLRVQARARASRALSENRLPGDGFQQIRLGPTTPLKYESPSNYRAAALKHDGACNVKRSAPSRAGNADTMDAGRGHCWNWLDRWMEERFSESGVEASSRADVATDEETSDKILEVDTGKPHLIPRRRPGCHSPSPALASDLTGRIFAAAQESSPINSAAVPSPTSVDLHRPLSPMRPPAGDATPEAYESPLLCSASSFSRPGSERRGPLTPAKSECSRSLYGGFAEFPSYMANTESSRAKFRSLSAPRLRPVSEKAASAFRQVPVVGTGCGHWSASSQKAAAAATVPTKFARRGNALSGRLDSRGLPVRH